MSSQNPLSPADAKTRRLSIGFLNWAHTLDHYVMLIFPTVVIGLEAVYGRSYGDLIALSTAAFTAFGLFALPAGWLADRWSRRNMIAVYYFGTGLSAIAVGLAPNFTVLAAALFGVGLFAAIYHPVGTPMLIDAAVSRGRTIAFSGVCGNIGVSIASGLTAAFVAGLGWRSAFFIPAALFILSGVAYLYFVPDDRHHHARRSPSLDVALDLRLAVAVIGLFLIIALTGGLIFNGVTVMLPKVLEAKLGGDVPLQMIGTLSTAVFLCGAVTQLAMGRIIERVPAHWLVAVVAVLQLAGIVWSEYASGWPLLFALVLAISAIYGQLTVNDVVLARYTPPTWRGRLYAIRFFLIFTSAGPAVWGIGRLYDHGGFPLVLMVAAAIAVVYVLAAIAITALVAGPESRDRVRAAQAAE
jgi:MFS family permease